MSVAATNVHRVGLDKKEKKVNQISTMLARLAKRGGTAKKIKFSALFVNLDTRVAKVQMFKRVAHLGNTPHEQTCQNVWIAPLKA